MNLTLEQAAAIAARGKVIVSASAGSGKTHVMIERFVSLLEEGVSVRRILAVTFTNKAAAQMRDRARKSLLTAYRDAKGEKRERLKRCLEELPLADISTIHAFCGRLVRAYFYLTGVDPRFRIVGTDDAEGRALAARAMDAAFEKAYDGDEPWFRALLDVYFRKKKDARLKGIVSDLYEKARNCADYRARLAAIAEERGDAEEAFARVGEELLRDHCLRLLSFARRAREAVPAVAAQASAAGVFLERAASCAEQLAGADSLCALYEAALQAELPRSPARSAKDAPEKTRAIALAQELAKEFRALRGELLEAGARYPEERAAFSEGRSRAAALARLTLLFDGEYSALKREAGALDYSDLEHLALEILQCDEARAAIREKYAYLFVDEYQDVNPMQCAVLDALAGEETFYVGDKKQAIYGFRGSRSRFFTEKQRAFGCSLGLNANFRSAPAILDAVNLVFRAAYGGDYTDMVGGERFRGYQGAVYAHVFGSEERAEERPPRGVYSVVGASAAQEDSPVARKALAIIEEECGERGVGGKTWRDADTGEERPVSYGDVAVLVRKRSGSAQAIVRALSERGIPVSAVAEVNVCDFFEARLLIDWLSYLDNPEQDIPLATAMLSALGGFTDGELALIRLKTDKSLGLYRARLPFRAACRAYAEGYRAGGDRLSKKLQAFYARTEEYRTLARVRTAPEMISLLLAEGLEAQIAAKGDGENRLARVRRLLAESRECASIHAFLRRLKSGGYFVRYSESGGENAVKVLTMHAAKGLEFPVVILADTDGEIRASERDETMWTDEYGISPRSFNVAARTYRETLARRAAAVVLRRQEAEGEKNLLYVAMTRARCRLHMLFSARTVPSAEDAARFYAPENARKMSDFIPPEFFARYLVTETEKTAAPEAARPLVYRADEETVRRIRAAGAEYPFAASVAVPVKSSATELMRDGGHSRAAEGKGFSAEEGTAYHAFLEHAAFGADAHEELARMRREGLLSEEQLSVLEEEKLRNILDIPCLRALKRADCVWRERKFLVPLSAADFPERYGGADDEIVFQGAIDLLARDESGYLILDYKYSARDDESLKRDYAVQIKLYRKAVAKILRVPEQSVRARIVNIALCREIEM